MITANSEKPNFINQHFKSIIFILGIIIFAAAYFLLWQPAFEKIKYFNSTLLQEKEAALTTKKILLNNLKEMEKKYLSITPETKTKISEFLPLSQDLPYLYNNLDQITKASGYKIIALTVNQKTDDEETGGKNSSRKQGLSTLIVNLKLEGSGYQNLKNFLLALENNLRIFDLESLNWDPTETNLELSFRTYYYLKNLNKNIDNNIPQL